MIQLRDNETDAGIGTISEENLKFLVDQLQEETSEDQDHCINETTLDNFAEAFGHGATGAGDEDWTRTRRPEHCAFGAHRVGGALGVAREPVARFDDLPQLPRMCEGQAIACPS